jgi:uncharacterized membrane protein YgcG
MNRSRRVTATVVAATGLLGGAGAAAATVAGHVANKSSKDDASTSAGAISGRHAETAAEKADALGQAALEDYVASMSERANRLGERVTAAEARLIAARSARARLIAHIHAKTAALARARVEAAATMSSAQTHDTSPPATHTSTGASSGGGDDGDDDEHEGGDGGGDDGGGGDD